MLYYAQALQQFRDGFFGKTDDLSKRLSHQIIRTAMWDVCRAHDWPYYYTNMRVATTAPYNTGHISIATATNTTVTGSGTTFTEAMVGQLLVAAGNYPAMQIKRYKDADEIFLREDHGWPGAALTSVDYNIYTQSYALPSDFRAMYSPIPNQFTSRVGFLDKDTIDALLASDLSEGEPRGVAVIRGTNKLFGSYVSAFTGYSEAERSLNNYLMFWPLIDDVYTYDFTYQRWPTWKTTNYDQGTVSTTGSTAVVTGVGTAWTTSMVGDYMAFGDANNAPDPVYGMDTTYRIANVVSGTSLYLAETPSAVTAGTKYRISSRLDMDERLEELFNLRMQYVLAMRRGDPRLYGLIRSEYKTALNDMKQDSDQTFNYSVMGAPGIDARSFWFKRGEVEI